MSSRPSILFVNQHYWPDHAATAQVLTDLAEYLAARGMDVTVLCSRGRYQAGQLRAPKRESRNGVDIVRLSTSAFGRGNHGGRMTDYATFFSQVAGRLLFGRSYDVVVTLTTPPLLATSAALARTLRGTRYGIWSMDLHPEAEFALGMLREDSLAGRVLTRLNRWSASRADFVVALGQCMRTRLEDQGVDPDRISVIPVWSNADEVEPVDRLSNPLRDHLGLNGHFVVMYSGNAGLAHRFDEVLASMLELRNQEHIFFLFVGDGPRRAEIEAFIAQNEIANARYIDYLPREHLRHSLPLGDVHLLTLRDDMAGVAVPSKLFGVMAAGRPVLMVGPQHSDPARIINEEGIGDVFSPNGGSATDGLTQAIVRLASDHAETERLGSRAREAFVRRYDSGHACKRWASLIEGLGAAAKGDCPTAYAPT